MADAIEANADEIMAENSKDLATGNNMGLSNWQKVCDGVFLFQDSCCVYAIQGPEGTVLINAGTGLVVDYLDEVFQNGSLTVLLTHHFRDHTDGAIRLRNAGCLLYTSPSPRDKRQSRMPSSA